MLISDLILDRDFQKRCFVTTSVIKSRIEFIFFYDKKKKTIKYNATLWGRNLWSLCVNNYIIRWHTIIVHYRGVLYRRCKLRINQVCFFTSCSNDAWMGFGSRQLCISPDPIIHWKIKPSYRALSPHAVWSAHECKKSWHQHSQSLPDRELRWETFTFLFISTASLGLFLNTNRPSSKNCTELKDKKVPTLKKRQYMSQLVKLIPAPRCWDREEFWLSVSCASWEFEGHVESCLCKFGGSVEKSRFDKCDHI